MPSILRSHKLANGPALIMLGCHCCRNSICFYIRCGAVWVLYTFLALFGRQLTVEYDDLTNSVQTQVTCLSPELPCWLFSKPHLSWDSRSHMSNQSISFIFYLSRPDDVSDAFVCGRHRNGDRVQHNRLATLSCVQLLCARAGVHKS